jgi:AraC-like DNA-binding protein
MGLEILRGKSHDSDTDEYIPEDIRVYEPPVRTASQIAYTIMSHHPDAQEPYLLIQNYTPDCCQRITLSSSSPYYHNLTKNRSLHKHDYCEFMVVTRGVLTQRIENQKFLYPAGSCCLLNPNTQHAEDIAGNYEVCFLFLTRPFINTFIEILSHAVFPEEQHFLNNPIILFLKSALLPTLQREYIDFIPVLAGHDEQAGIHELLRQLTEVFLHPVESATFQLHEIIHRVFSCLGNPNQYHMSCFLLDDTSDYVLFSRITHLMKEADGRLSRSELEELLHYNGSYLNEIVKKHTGMSIFDYGMQFCMKKAEQLLDETALSVEEIAFRLKFTNRTHFYQIFKESYGMTPREYRKHRHSN